MAGQVRIFRGRGMVPKNVTEAYIMLPPGHRFNPGSRELVKRFYINSSSGPVFCKDPRWYRPSIEFVFTAFADRERLPDINRVWATPDTLIFVLKRNLLMAMARDGTPQIFKGNSHRITTLST